MDIALFNFLEGISPWWWVAFAFVLGAIEMVTMSFFLIWPGLAALIMAVILWVAPGLNGTIQVLLYAALAIAMTFVGRSYLNRFGDGGAPATTLNQRSEQLIGRRAKVLESDGIEGAVEIDGMRWKALWEPAHIAGASTVTITAADGMVLKVADAV